MFTLLPEHHKKDLYSEYRLRLLTIFFCLVSGAILVDVFLFLPSHIYVKAEKESLVVEGESLERMIEEKNQTGIADTLSVIRDATTVLSEEERSAAYEALQKIAARLPDGVSLTGLTYTGNTEGESTLVLEAEADVRKNAILFADNLKKEDSFSSVVLPISDLAKDVDLVFHITVQGKF